MAMTKKEEWHNYVAEWGNGMVRCNCGLAVSTDKMEMHLASEHKVKVFSDAVERQKQND